MSSCCSQRSPPPPPPSPPLCCCCCCCAYQCVMENVPLVLMRRQGVGAGREAAGARSQCHEVDNSDDEKFRSACCTCTVSPPPPPSILWHNPQHLHMPIALVATDLGFGIRYSGFGTRIFFFLYANNWTWTLQHMLQFVCGNRSCL